MDRPRPIIAILGASGLIGEAAARWLLHDGFVVVPIARRFTSAQKAAFGGLALERPIVALDADALAYMFSERNIDIVVNCVGVLQDGPRGSTDAAHRVLAERLVTACGSRTAPMLLVHVSIPGKSEDDRTPFSRTKRAAERIISEGRVPYVILRPGFVVAASAYGGSALVRALAALPFDLPARGAGQPFATTEPADIARTIAFLGRRWGDGERNWKATWDVMERHPSTAGDVVKAFTHHFGGAQRRVRLPSWLMEAGARVGDCVAHLGWSPPVRSTALQEMWRGVSGDPRAWIAATDIEPASLASMLLRVPTSVQEKWFARLYLAKPLIIGSLVAFWVVSGMIALTVAFGAAAAILTTHGFASPFAKTIAVASSLADVAVGVTIAFKSTCRAGLLAGISISLAYMAGATVLTPDLWIEPLGALVKTGPAIVLMLVALATLEDR